jgi:hypothetical protein
MIPWRNPITPEQQNSNNIFKRERIVIERCFGQLKSRFPILQYKIRNKIENIPSIIICCVVLHNIAKFLKDDDFDYPKENNLQDVLPNRNMTLNVIRQLGKQRRHLITQMLFN